MPTNGIVGPITKAAADLAKTLVKAKVIKPAVGALAVLLALLAAFEASVLPELPETCPLLHHSACAGGIRSGVNCPIFDEGR